MRKSSLILFAVLVFVSCDWRWSDIPYRGESVETPVVKQLDGAVVPAVAVAVVSRADQELNWLAVATDPPHTEAVALVNVNGVVRGLSSRSEGQVRAVFLGTQALVFVGQKTEPGWRWLDFDEESQSALADLAVFAGQGTPYWVARVVPGASSASLAVLPRVAGGFVCAPLCAAGDLLFDRQGNLTGKVAASGLQFQPVPLQPGAAASDTTFATTD